jgi:tRNA threonylcarbamoyladenosine biosynthesis protein TsaB
VSESLLVAVECATPLCSVALLRGEATLAELRAPADAPAAETLLPALDQLLRGAGVGVDAVGAWAISIGPGSFTSLRIGIATLKGLAFGRPTPAVPVPTLAALARGAGDRAEPVVSLLDARRGEVYAGAWMRRGLEPHPCLPEGIYTPRALVERLPGRAVLVGDAALLGEALEARDASELRRVPPPEGEPSARRVGALGAELLALGRAVDVADLVPVYGRRAEAEVRRLRRSL